jgi:glucosyl-3-phosphoglycerate synthase
MLGPLPFLEYLDSYRYPLSGEFSLRAFLARSIRIPSNLGLEIGLLCEAYRNCTPRHICQVDLSIDYEHKHELSYEDPTKGLLKMCIDIAGYLFATLAAEGIVFTDNLLKDDTGGLSSHCRGYGQGIRG